MDENLKAVPLPELTAEQREYLEKIVARIGKYDPETVIGGPDAQAIRGLTDD